MKQREIKFRAWSKQAQFMASWELIQEKENLHRLVGHREYILMQFTGLYSKSGQPIYEGDIVEITRMKFYTGWRKYPAEVRWSDEVSGWGVMLRPRKSLEGAKQRWKSAAWLMNLKHTREGNGVEVIGNVWENPELLKA